MIDTSKVTPTITTNGVTDNGLFFQSTAKTGSASMFLFGTTSLFDNQLNFYTTSTDNDNSFSNSGVYKFSALQMEGNPSILTKAGSNKVTLISQTDITSSPLGGTVNFSGLNSLFLGTVSGSISLSDKFTFTKLEGDTFKLIQLYARVGA